jgi:hypothetical protein
MLSFSESLPNTDFGYREETSGKERGKRLSQKVEHLMKHGVALCFSSTSIGNLHRTLERTTHTFIPRHYPHG